MQRGLPSPQAQCSKHLGSASVPKFAAAPLRLARRSKGLGTRQLLVRAKQATSAAPADKQQEETHSNGNGAAALGSPKHIAENPNDLDFDSVTARELAENGIPSKILSTTDASTQ